jgi:RNA polymerase sigma-70 factor (ECF subfamily)
VDPDKTELSDGGQSARRIDDRLTLARIRANVDRLPDDQRAVLVLVAIEGLNYREAAEVLGLPMGTVMSRLSRARSRLLDMMDVPPEEARAWAR